MATAMLRTSALLAVIMALAAAPPEWVATAADAAPAVLVAEVDAIIHPISS
jgi:hypothetical protein